MKYLYALIGYLFAAFIFTMAIPLILLYSMHKVAIKTADMVTDGLK